MLWLYCVFDVSYLIYLHVLSVFDTRLCESGTLYTCQDRKVLHEYSFVGNQSIYRLNLQLHVRTFCNQLNSFPSKTLRSLKRHSMISGLVFQQVSQCEVIQNLRQLRQLKNVMPLILFIIWLGRGTSPNYPKCRLKDTSDNLNL